MYVHVTMIILSIMCRQLLYFNSCVNMYNSICVCIIMYVHEQHDFQWTVPNMTSCMEMCTCTCCMYCGDGDGVDCQPIHHSRSNLLLYSGLFS